MKIIYSQTAIKGLEGCYIAPFRFKGQIEMGATEVYTDNAKIKKAYLNVCDVFAITPKKAIAPTVEIKD